MTPHQQHNFIKELIASVEKDMYSKTFPENWDGIELRLYVAEKFHQCVWGDISKPRRKAYENDMLINNL